MKIDVKVKPNTKEDRLERTGERAYLARVKAKPSDGKANLAVVTLLAKYFSLPKSRIILRTGQASRTKVFEIL